MEENCTTLSDTVFLQYKIEIYGHENYWSPGEYDLTRGEEKLAGRRRNVRLAVQLKFMDLFIQ